MGQEQGRGQAAAVRDELTALNRLWADALEQRDVVRVMDFFTDDAVLAVAGAPLLQGAASIRKGFEAVFARGGPAPVFTPGRIWESGDLVVDVGTYRSDADRLQHGRYVVVWQRQADGSLKALVDMSAPD